MNAIRFVTARVLPTLTNTASTVPLRSSIDSMVSKVPAGFSTSEYNLPNGVSGLRISSSNPLRCTSIKSRASSAVTFPR